VIGYLINPLALRIDLSDDPPLAALLARVSAMVIEAMRHASCPFPLIVERLQPARKAGGSPLFDVMFVLDRSHRREVEGLAHVVAGRPGFRTDIGGLPVETIGIDRRSAQFDLTLLLFETPSALSGSWEYDADLFSEATIRRFADRYVALLRTMAEDPRETLSGAAAALS
jgi:non-ribosomal peptide synthetase component F